MSDFPNWPVPKVKPVRRCVCHDVTFAELKASGLTSVEDISREFKAGTNCGNCIPYIKRMLETGEVAFEIID